MVTPAIRAGAAGYVPKSADGHTLLSALRIVLAGEICIPPRYLGSAAAGAAADSPRPPCASTERHLQVLSLLSDGMSNKSIARQLGIAEATVKLHVSAILKELGARNRTEAVIPANDLGLLCD